MTVVRTRHIGLEVVISANDLARLVELARMVDDVEVQGADDLPSWGIASLADEGGSFAFLAEEPELYSVSDLKVRYQ